MGVEEKCSKNINVSKHIPILPYPIPPSEEKWPLTLDLILGGVAEGGGGGMNVEEKCLKKCQQKCILTHTHPTLPTPPLKKLYISRFWLNSDPHCPHKGKITSTTLNISRHNADKHSCWFLCLLIDLKMKLEIFINGQLFLTTPISAGNSGTMLL